MLSLNAVRCLLRIYTSGVLCWCDRYAGVPFFGASRVKRDNPPFGRLTFSECSLKSITNFRLFFDQQAITGQRCAAKCSIFERFSRVLHRDSYIFVNFGRQNSVFGKHLAKQTRQERAKVHFLTILKWGDISL